MPGQSVQDPFGGKGPFDQYLDATRQAEQNRPRFDQGQQFNGYEGGLGKSLGIFTKFAEGLSKGRVAAFARKEQEKHDAWSVMQKQAETVLANPQTTEAQKQKILTGLGNLWAKQQQAGLKTSDAAKDKGQPGMIHKAMSGFMDTMAGGKLKSPEGWDVNDVVGFQKILQGVSNDAESTVQKQSAKLRQEFTNILPKIEADTKARTGFNVLSREHLLQHPDMQNILDRAGQISPDTRGAFDQLIGSYPSGDNPQTRQRMEYGYGLDHPEMIQPPATRAENWMARPAQGYIEGQQPPASVVRLPEGQDSPLSPLSRSYQGPPMIDPHFEAKQDLRAIAAGYRLPNVVNARNPYTGEMEYGISDRQAQEWDKELTRRQNTTREEDRVRQAGDKLAFAKTKQEDHKEEFRKTLSVAQQNANAHESSSAAQWASANLRDEEFRKLREGPTRALGRAFQLAVNDRDDFDLIASDIPGWLAKHADEKDFQDPGNVAAVVNGILKAKNEKDKKPGSSGYDAVIAQLTGQAPATPAPPAARPAATAKPKAATATQKQAAPVHPATAELDSLFGTGTAAPPPATRTPADPMGLR